METLTQHHKLAWTLEGQLQSSNRLLSNTFTIQEKGKRFYGNEKY